MIAKQREIPSANTSALKPDVRHRAAKILASEIHFIDNPGFKSRSAKRSILGPPINLDFRPAVQVKSGSLLPSHLARLCDAPLLSHDEEQTLFQRMNYLYYRAHALRGRLSAARPHQARVDEIEDLLDQAAAVKNRIVASNVRLVVSIVKQLAPTPTTFDEMLSEGLLAMIRAAEKFDFDRGFRFSTYATMVVRRQLYRLMKNDHRDRSRFPTGDSALLLEHPESEVEPRIGYQGWVQLSKSLMQMLTDLDERERKIIRARFGFDTDGKKQTLQSLATEYGVCKERVRQLEKRAMAKLRAAAENQELQGLLDPEFRS